MGHPSPPDKWVEDACRRYPTNVLAAKALNMSKGGFQVMTKKRGIRTPAQRKLDHYTGEAFEEKMLWKEEAG